MTLYDVVAVNLNTRTVRLLDRNKSGEDAEAIVMMAVMWRCEDELYSIAKSGKYNEGDAWAGIE